eukprot:m.27088 g.27088  ORF g.27088 m.27088 type:complete len:58 (+) comp6388_c0_seq2:1650-1823(+)
MPDVDLPAEVRLEDQVADHRLAGQRQSREEDLEQNTVVHFPPVLKNSGCEICPHGKH